MAASPDLLPDSLVGDIVKRRGIPMVDIVAAAIDERIKGNGVVNIVSAQELARIAIRAMRQPSPRMVFAGLAGTGGPQSAAAWNC